LPTANRAVKLHTNNKFLLSWRKTLVCCYAISHNLQWLSKPVSAAFFVHVWHAWGWKFSHNDL